MTVSDLKQTRLWVKTGMDQMEHLDVGLCGTATHSFGIVKPKVKPKKDNDRARHHPEPKVSRAEY